MGRPKRHCCQHTSACVWQWVGRSATAASTRPRSGMRQPIRGHSSQQGCLSGPTSVQLLLHRSSRSSATPTCSAAGLPQFSRSFTDQPRETPRVQSLRLPPVRPRCYLSSAGASPISHARHHGFSRRLPPHHRARLPQFSRGFTVQPRRDTQFGQRLERYRPEAPSSARDTTGTASRHPVRPKTRAVPPGGTQLSQRHNRYRLAGPTSVQPKLHRSTCCDAPRLSRPLRQASCHRSAAACTMAAA